MTNYFNNRYALFGLFFIVLAAIGFIYEQKHIAQVQEARSLRCAYNTARDVYIDEYKSQPWFISRSVIEYDTDSNCSLIGSVSGPGIVKNFDQFAEERNPDLAALHEQIERLESSYQNPSALAGMTLPLRHFFLAGGLLLLLVFRSKRGGYAVAGVLAAPLAVGLVGSVCTLLSADDPSGCGALAFVFIPLGPVLLILAICAIVWEIQYRMRKGRESDL